MFDGNRGDGLCGFAFVYGRELSDEFNRLVSGGFVGKEIADDGRLPIGVARDPNIPAYPRWQLCAVLEEMQQAIAKAADNLTDSPQQTPVDGLVSWRTPVRRRCDGRRYGNRMIVIRPIVQFTKPANNNPINWVLTRVLTLIAHQVATEYQPL